MRYKVFKSDIDDPEIASSEWDKAQVGSVGVNRWTDFQIAPETTFRVLRSDMGFTVLINTKEKHLRAECREQNGDVYCDSCIEFFIKPDNHDVNYLNFEFNPLGVLHLGLGSGRHGRMPIDTDRAVFDIVSVAREGDWTLKFFVPFSFLLEHFGKISKVFRANVYKCGEMTDHSHFGAWSEVEVDSPDFHVPDFFGFFET
jgi:hypothetical protein